MNNYKIVRIVVEGPTEEKFIKKIVGSYLLSKGIQIIPIVLHGDVKFDRVKGDVIKSLKDRKTNAVSYFVDYYGLKEWPEKNAIQANSTPQQIADILNNAAKNNICKEAGDDLNPSQRFIPFMAVHEFETLLFSDSKILAEELGIQQDNVDDVLNEFGGSPENINNSPETAPSKRLERWKANYKKTVDGISIAEKIGLSAIREKCLLFDNWLTAIESF